MGYKDPEKQKQYFAIWYKKNHKKFIKQVAAATTRRKSKNVGIISALKLKTGCALCGYRRCARALEFHHYQDNKSFSVSVGILGLGMGMRKIMLEVDKCILLCSNCHQEVEAGDALVVQRLEHLTFNQVNPSSSLGERTM